MRLEIGPTSIALQRHESVRNLLFLSFLPFLSSFFLFSSFFFSSLPFLLFPLFFLLLDFSFLTFFFPFLPNSSSLAQVLALWFLLPTSAPSWTQCRGRETPQDLALPWSSDTRSTGSIRFVFSFVLLVCFVFLSPHWLHLPALVFSVHPASVCLVSWGGAREASRQERHPAPGGDSKGPGHQPALPRRHGRREGAEEARGWGVPAAWTSYVLCKSLFHPFIWVNFWEPSSHFPFFAFFYFISPGLMSREHRLSHRSSWLRTTVSKSGPKGSWLTGMARSAPWGTSGSWGNR